MTTEQKPAGRGRKHIRMLGLAVLLTATGAACGFFALNYHGYCFARGRVVSDQEKIDTAIASLLGMLKSAEPEASGAGVTGLKIFPYADAAEFFRMNPDCCTVTKEIQDEGVHRIDDIDRTCGFVSDFVTIKYVQRYRDNKGIEHHKAIKTHYVVDQCGNEKTI